jgi:hypothetical protein
MKRGILILLAVCAVAVTGYFTASKWLIRHERLSFYDATRDRPIAVDIAIRRDKEMQANAGMLTLPVAIVNHGNTVKYTEYSFLSNVLAARGYMAVSIQHDLPRDAPLVTKVGQPYVGRLPVYERGIANIEFTVEQMKKVQPHADYNHLTLVGHSNGGDIAMFFAKEHPEQVKKIVTLDNLRVPFITDGRFKILSFRSKDPNFKADPGVVPNDDQCEEAGITVVKTGYQHTDMSDRGPEKVKESIQNTLNKFLSDDSVLKPVSTDKIKVPKPGPVAQMAPAAQ